MTDRVITDKCVLVTGASGFVGRHCLPRLVARGFSVHAVRRRPTAETDRAVSGVFWHQVDLFDPAAMDAILTDVAPTHLLHLAWDVTPGAFWTSKENLRWLELSVRLARRFGETGGMRAVGVGTCAEYDWSHGFCHEYTTPTVPATAYGEAKLAAGHALLSAGAAHKFSAAWARPFFPYGPGEARLKLIPSVICGLLRSEPVSCSHGLQVRDYIYIADVAEALVALTDSTANGFFNVGTGSPVSLREIVKEITNILGHAELIHYGERSPQPGEPEALAADIGRMMKFVGWRPAVSLASGIASSIAVWRAHEAVEVQ